VPFGLLLLASSGRAKHSVLAERQGKLVPHEANEARPAINGSAGVQAPKLASARRTLDTAPGGGGGSQDLVVLVGRLRLHFPFFYFANFLNNYFAI
jgi:hypothetical protein